MPYIDEHGRIYELDPRARPLNEAGYLERGGLAETGFDPSRSVVNALSAEPIPAYEPSVDYHPLPMVLGGLAGAVWGDIDRAVNDPTPENVAPVALDWGLLGLGTTVARGRNVLRTDPTELNMGIRAYHGSPHDFDRFSIDKIGTGEGAQAYGHGLYFAEAEDVAKGYRDELNRPGFVSADGAIVTPDSMHLDAHAARYLQQAGGDYAAARKKAKSSDPAWRDEIIEILDEYEAGGFVSDGNSGHMYEVNINADPDDFLDWDAPLSEQSPRVQEALAAASRDLEKRDQFDLIGLNPDRIQYDPNTYGSAAYHDVVNVSGGTDWPVASNAATRQKYRQEGAIRASDRFNDAGIPGIKYKDGFSRGGEGGTRNYVVFDENLIEIIRKYGWAGVAPLFANALAPDPEY